MASSLPSSLFIDVAKKLNFYIENVNETTLVNPR